MKAATVAFALGVLLLLGFLFSSLWNTATPHERAVNACVQRMTTLYRWQRKQICEISVTNMETQR